jgi:hypothetical protein
MCLRLPLLFLLSALRFHRMPAMALQDRRGRAELRARLCVRAEPIRLRCAAPPLVRIRDSAWQ